LSDNFVWANVLNDISNFETGQKKTVAVTNIPTLNTFRIPGIQSTSGLTISSINNYTVNFKLSSIIYHFWKLLPWQHTSYVVTRFNRQYSKIEGGFRKETRCKLTKYNPFSTIAVHAHH